jgi:hypothetical protein
MKFQMTHRTHNAEGRRLVKFDLNSVPLAAFGTCPRRSLPNVKGRIVEVLHSNRYIFQIGPLPNDVIHVVEGAAESPRQMGDIEWLEYNSPGRAAHHRFWSVKFQEMQDDRYIPIDALEK